MARLSVKHILMAVFFLISCKLQAQKPVLPDNIHTTILKQCRIYFLHFAAQVLQYKGTFEKPGPSTQKPEDKDNEKKSYRTIQEKKENRIPGI
jgi:hypothetical protein